MLQQRFLIKRLLLLMEHRHILIDGEVGVIIAPLSIVESVATQDAHIQMVTSMKTIQEQHMQMEENVQHVVMQCKRIVQQAHGLLIQHSTGRNVHIVVAQARIVRLIIVVERRHVQQSQRVRHVVHHMVVT